MISLAELEALKLTYLPQVSLRLLYRLQKLRTKPSTSLNEGNSMLQRLNRERGKNKQSARLAGAQDFAGKQTRVALRNCGLINPESIEESIAFDGYRAFGRVLTQHTPEDVVMLVKSSGLRGRNNEGASVGERWEAQRREANLKLIVCKMGVSEPGAYLDRHVLEEDPHTVIEGMAIAAWAVGASKGCIRVREEYTVAVKRLRHAIDQAERLGLLGDNLFGTAFSFTIELRCGVTEAQENTSMGRDHHALTETPEAYAGIPVIINKGPEWYKSLERREDTGRIIPMKGAEKRRSHWR